MKIYCKKRYKLNDGTELYTKGKWYDVRAVEVDESDQICAYDVQPNYPNMYDSIYFFYDRGYKQFYFEKYFRNLQELRKEKLEKINGKN